MNQSQADLINQFERWILEIQYNMMSNELFQPIGLETSCSNIIFETSDNYTFKYELEKDPEHCPLAWNDMNEGSIHIFIEHPVWALKRTTDEKRAFLLFLIAHEAEHSLLLHKTRGKDYDPTIFNVAGDMEIHNMFYVYNEIIKTNNSSSGMHAQQNSIYAPFTNYVAPMIFNKSNKKAEDMTLDEAWSGLWEKDYLNMTAEEIYASLMNNKQVEVQSFDFTLDENGEQMNDSSPAENSSSKNKKGGKKNKDSNDGDNDDKTSNSNKDGLNQGPRGKIIKTTYTTKGGKKITTVHVEFDQASQSQESNEESEREKANGRLTRSTLSKNILQKKIEEMNNSEGRGTMPSACHEFLKKLLKVKVDWKKILKNSIVTAMEKDEYFSWAKPRHSLFGLDYDVYLPDQIESEASYGTLIVARDESGSMSDDDCAKAAQVIKESKEYYKKVIVLKHDTEISTVDTLEDESVSELEEKLLHTRTACGGTSHEKVFEYIRDYNKQHDEGDPERISACIFITDMESDIQETQNIAPVNIPRIWLVPKDCAQRATGMTESGEVSGKIVVLE